VHSYCKHSLSASRIQAETPLSAWADSQHWTTGIVDTKKEQEPQLIIRQLLEPRTSQTELDSGELSTTPFLYYKLHCLHYKPGDDYSSLMTHPKYPRPTIVTDSFSLGQLTRSGTLIIEPVPSDYAKNILFAFITAPGQIFIRFEATAKYLSQFSGQIITHSPPLRTFKLSSPNLNQVVLVFHIFEQFLPWREIPLERLATFTKGWYLVHFYGDPNPA
jgi:hypothetical protein